MSTLGHENEGDAVMGDPAWGQSGLWTQPPNWSYDLYGETSSAESSFVSSSSERSGLGPQESDAISALASLAHNPGGDSEEASTSETAANGRSDIGITGLYHWPQQNYAGGSGNGYGSQFHLHDIFPDVMKSIDQKLVELEQQKRLSGFGGWTEALGRGSYPAAAYPFPSWPPAQTHLGSNWRRFLTPADQLSYPPLGLAHGLPKVAEWQLSTLLARYVASALTSSAHSPPVQAVQVHSVSTAAGESGTSVVGSKDRPVPKTDASGEALEAGSGQERLWVVKNVEKTFRLRIRREHDAQVDRDLLKYFGEPVRKFTERGFELRPFSDRILLHDGAYESPDSLKHRLENNIGQKTDQCKCLGSEVSEELEGPYYTHLGAAPNIPALRRIMEEKLGETGEALRIERVVYTGKEGRTQDGCPLAKWIIRRASYREKVLCVVRERPGHRCASAVLCVLVVLWEGIPDSEADSLYTLFTKALPTGGMPTNRRCALNDQRTCACQGVDDNTGGASFSFGCSWSMYYNTCKFARSRNPKRFKLLEAGEEAAVEERLQALADLVAHQYSRVAPCAYRNQTYLSYRAPECRLGNRPGGPFTGVTACVDFCSHSHRDVHNMSNGCTVVVTLTRNRGLEKVEDEQFHVLPLYIPSRTDELGSEEAQKLKAETGAVEVLDKYPMLMRYRKDPLPNCKSRLCAQLLLWACDVCDVEERNKRPCPATQRPSPTFMTSPPQFKVEPTGFGMGNYGGFAAYPYPYSGYPGYPYASTIAYPASQHPGPLSQWPGYADPFAQWPRPEAEPRGVKRTASVENGDAVPEGFYTAWSDNEAAFADPQIGGVAVALGHGSIAFEVAKKELHSTTALKRPDRRDPKRISLVFYQHKNLCFVNHGFDEWDRRLAAKKQGRPDIVATTRAAASKVRFDLRLPSSVRAPPLHPNKATPTNTALTLLRSGYESVSSKSRCTLVDSKGASEAKKEDKPKT